VPTLSQSCLLFDIHVWPHASPCNAFLSSPSSFPSSDYRIKRTLNYPDAKQEICLDCQEKHVSKMTPRGFLSFELSATETPVKHKKRAFRHLSVWSSDLLNVNRLPVPKSGQWPCIAS